RVRVGGPGSAETEEVREEWRLYALSGPKIVSALYVAAISDDRWPRGRLLVHDENGEVKHAIDLSPPPQPEPCHPGCFPVGTVVRVPGGAVPIEEIREGDFVTTVDADGRPASAKVWDVFVTRNRLLDVRTAEGTLRTTLTQPLALERGGFRTAAELKAGDRLWRWRAAERHAATVLEVTAPLGDSRVFNLVLGDPTTFIASGFLVRSKPLAGPVQP
ncbi:MAG: Hint domain-containing protein, partial [Planctomycetia bacterium]